MGQTGLRDFTIIGGGIVGATLALELSRHGLSVELLERRELAREASWASAGIISPPSPRYGTKLELGLRAYRRYPALIAEVQDATGIDVGYVHTGEIEFGPEANRERMRAALEWQTENGMQVEWIDSAAELRDREPVLMLDEGCGFYAAEAGSVILSRLTTAIARAAALQGALIREHTPVLGINVSQGRVASVQTFEGEHTVGAVIIAAGAWSRTLGDSLDVSIPTVPVRGQMLAIESPPIPMTSVVAAGGIYVVPRADGSIAVGATEEHDAGFDTGVTPAGIAWLTERIEALAPSLNQGRLSATWAGLRPGTADGDPIIGRVPHVENAWIATGHFRSGALLAPATAELLTASIISGDSDPVLQPFDPARFAVGS